MVTSGVAEGVLEPESTISCTAYGQGYEAPSGSESTACHQSQSVNVGEPDKSFDESIGLRSFSKQEKSYRKIG